ncbi:ExbD/TolR family protein [Leeuwenhoekiella parthenopeia]|uniref:Biopolymer transporter ExbD n=1 Tax=Leeuwenhoekiella parthenopeia TaxID=2890320 RepID=A0ABS8GT51_9FLAO|nr:biopolymer transporter ExbD [Leeuwenhoekiella parthenopeia]MCC4212311.1 biopolymer transporter ExbD [Leeuwenhoekiella parthenopeia]
MRTTTSVNAGSMADIAFLMLIFFLTTTTIETDKGLSQTLPDPCLTKDCTAEIAERNLLRISINGNGEYLINERVIQLEELSTQVVNFVMNTEKSAVKPSKPENAVVNLELSRELDYGTYIQVLDGVKQAYQQMRSDYSFERFSKALDQLNERELEQVLQAYPLNLGESAPARL